MCLTTHSSSINNFLSTEPCTSVYLRYNPKKLTYEQRKARLVERLNALNSSGGVDDDEDDE
jgi:large subunit ribosomal protein L5e